jgi:hypothetical protein
MAEIPGQAPAPLPTAEEVAAHNAAIRAKLEGQDAAGNPRPDTAEQATAGDALDAIAKQVEAKAGKEVDVEPAAPKKPPVEPKTETDPAAKAAAEEAAKKAAADKEARDAEIKRADETIFKDAPRLPQGASVKSSEAFETIKLRASQEISKLSSELETTKKSLAEKEAAAGKLPADVEQQLKEAEELKKWRAKMDVDFDPKFKEFDKSAEQKREFIYAQLKKCPAITDATLEKIKKLGGPDKVQMKPLFDALNDTITQRLIESKLADIEMDKYNKEQAVAQTKTNIDEYINARQQELSKVATEDVAGVKKELDVMWEKFDWSKPQTAKAGATDAEKTAVDTHNKFTAQIRKELDEAAAVNTPQMKATLLASAAQLFNLQGVHKTLKESFEKLEAEAKELREFKGKFRNATRSRLPESQAPSAGAASLQKPVNQFNTGAADGLDAIAKQVMAERAAKAGQA